MDVKLVVLIGKAKGREIPLPRSQFIIGRAQNCHLRPHSELVSKLHCAIVCRGDQVIVRDLKSRNKTYVNDEPVTSTVRVHDGDILTVGPLKFRFMVEGEVEGGLAPELRKDHVRWLMEDSDSFDVDTSCETTIVDIPQELLAEIEDAKDSSENEETEDEATHHKKLSAGKYLKEYFEPKEPGESKE